MTHFVIRCPRTGANVQVWVSESTSVAKADEYEGVTCPACAWLHFVHKITGRLLGERAGGLSEKNIRSSDVSGAGHNPKGRPS
jgi:hypothetical protein